MTAKKKHERTERESTDASLEGERRKADDEIMKRAEAVESAADVVVARARELAEQVLDRARGDADEKLRAAGAGSAEQAVVEEERAREDEIVRDERDVADEVLAGEREARRAALAALMATERDMTDTHLVVERDRLDVAVRSRDDFLGMASHDLRNMLGGVAMSAALLLRVPADEATKTAIAREAHRIQRFTAQMNRLVGDLLDVASIEAGRLAMFPAPHDGSTLLRETLEAFLPVALSKGITLRADVRARELAARFDHDRLLQVLTNLVGNAIKFTPARGSIELTVEATERELEFAVTDSGPGIEAEKLGLVFDRFWQEARRDHTSFGLGLFIARSIIEAHGGRIWVESTVGQGATFRFTLPRAPAAG